MLKKLLVVAAMSAITASAFAVDRSQVAKSYELKDGSTVYIYKDGKMGMEDKLGRATYMKPNVVMETKDGSKIIMIGNEVWRVDKMLHGDANSG
jgi:Copper resistance protein K